MSEHSHTDRKDYILGNGYIGEKAENAGSYYITDEQDSVRYVISESGEPERYQQYDAFGNTLIRQGKKCRLGYNSQQEDELTGLYYLRARYYQPKTGRFIQEDVLYNDGLNLYAYCNSNH